ncbi:hypothetical protein VOLCADRAFT_107929 [Volvox carteri f. nagariensis]|uniref:Uncharacterized protein n=1 Tax=Volvox carteri f. nagariensis TaxID=3068 RepID=D8UH92_VOLCA|nr:uncharacterized protein VOLCADRAFT_107929 [Volvox carteri f. nagariensis]EFJ40865.1 hypothetical protein VOLCADRAFT_107929 [Volvox carteri f. nagariensis]|eukprot:XP_002958025.1 hypothetical protein VOLCADRAFT_107929 [Volvox carteri f. nagariensis]
MVASETRSMPVAEGRSPPRTQGVLTNRGNGRNECTGTHSNLRSQPALAYIETLRTVSSTARPAGTLPAQIDCGRLSGPVTACKPTTRLQSLLGTILSQSERQVGQSPANIAYKQSNQSYASGFAKATPEIT